MLHRLKRDNQRWRGYSNMLIQENKWRAQRYGFDEGLIDFGKGVIVPYESLLEEIIALTTPSAEELGCKEQLLHARTILGRGTGAHEQVRVYDEAIAAGADKKEALKDVVDFLIGAFLPD
jgi:carboxylate-amine ligase